MNRKKKLRIRGGKRVHIALNVGLGLLLAVSLLLFASAYRQLKASIQSERADSVRQISALIADRVSRLRQTYVDEITQTARVIESAGIDSLADLSRVQYNSGRLVLVDEQGGYRALDGSAPLIDDPELLVGLTSGEGAVTSFATIQTRGDYWLFAKRLRDVTLDGTRYIGVILTVSAQEYADVATISLYDHQGESLVVAQDGTIKMRPTEVGAASSFRGYNLLKILEKSDLDEGGQRALARALRNRNEYTASCGMNGVTWLIQSVPSESGRNIVVPVPVSLTAQSTYRGMTNTLVCAAVSILLMALMFLYNFAEVLRKNQQIEVEHARSKSKSDFLDKMSHDIRTPLNAIVWMHELALQSMDDPATVYDCLTKAKRSSSYLVGVINDVLDMSRIESGKMTVAHKPFDLQELLDSVVQIESSAAAEKRIKLAETIRTPITGSFLGDAQRLRQCLMNLVNNSVKFTPPGGHITLSYTGETRDDARVLARFSVTDDGVGMTEEFMQKLFRPFEQEANSLYNAYSGSGLGLSIVREFVTLMGGTVTAESKKGEGSTFVIELPLEIAEDVQPEEPPVGDEELEAQIRGKRVLLVEDNAINRQILSALLERMGLSVDAAENGQIAVEKFRASPQRGYALILMDIMMPIMGGLEATEIIRKSGRPDAATIPIIALSANAFEEDAKKSLAAGMQMHLAKPVDVDELKRVLKKYVR